MIDQPDNSLLEHLLAIRRDVAAIRTDIVEIKERLGHMEGLYASLSRRTDRMSGDIEVIRRRVDIVPAGAE